MTDYPPPGAPPPPGPPPAAPPGPPAPSRWGVAPPPVQGWQPAPGMLGAAHKPGAIPLRPLRLGEIYDGAFRIIRFNPKATVGSAVLVATVTMMLPVVVTAILTWTIGTTFDAADSSDSSVSDDIGTIGGLLTLGLGAILQIFGLLFVTGMIVHVTAAAAVGRRLTLEQAWAATRGKRWRLVGLTLLLWVMTLALVTVFVVGLVLAFVAATTTAAVVFTIVWSLVFVAGMLWFWIRVYYLPVPALMLEPVGVIGSIGRGFRLTRKQFWRTFGIALLTYVIAQIGGSMLTAPLSVGGQFVIIALGDEYALLGLVVLQALTSVVSAAFVAPFSAAVASLQYVDQRMRKEGFDVELMTRAGLVAR